MDTQRSFCEPVLHGHKFLSVLGGSGNVLVFHGILYKIFSNGRFIPLIIAATVSEIESLNINNVGKALWCFISLSLSVHYFSQTLF